VSARVATSPIWLLRIALPGAWGRFTTSALILAALLGWFYLAGNFDADETDASPPAAVFFAVILAYIIPVFHFITEQTERAFDQLTPHLDADTESLRTWRKSIREQSARAQFVNLGFGLLAWAAHTLLLYGTMSRMFHSAMTDAARFAFAFAPMFVWVAMICAIGGLVDNALLFRRLAKYTRIDLLNPAPLTAFGRVAAISTLGLVGAEAAFPLLWLEADRALVTSLPGLLGTAGAMVALFVLPIWPIRRVIASAKKRELERVNAALAEARAGVDGDASRPHIERLSPYLTYRREIADVNDWPFDSNIVTRLAFYLVIPPLTWLGAAIIDVAVERVM
jgi:hypothetical protein